MRTLFFSLLCLSCVAASAQVQKVRQYVGFDTATQVIIRGPLVLPRNVTKADSIGSLRFNTTDSTLEIYQGPVLKWQKIQGTGGGLDFDTVQVSPFVDYFTNEGYLFFVTVDGDTTDGVLIGSGGGSGTVTSVATNTATGITGGTITTTGTLALDTTLIATRAWRQKGVDTVISVLNANYWSKNLNSVTNLTDKFGSSNNASVNLYANNTRYWQLDSLGAFNIFPGTSPRTALTIYRNSSTTTKSLWLTEEGDDPYVNTYGSPVTFRTVNLGTTESFRITQFTPGSTRGANANAILVGKLQTKVAAPSGTELSYGLNIANASGTDRYSLGLNSSEEAVFGVNNVAFNLNEANTASNQGTLLRVWDYTGNVHIKNKGTYTQSPSARLNVESTNQGFLPPVLTQTQRNNMVGSIVSVTISTAGSGYTNGTYTGVSLPGSGSGTGATANITVSGGAITLVELVNRGTGYINSEVLLPTGLGAGTGLSLTVTSGVGIVPSLAAGLMIYCSDCTATDGSTGVTQTWNGSTWKNNW